VGKGGGREGKLASPGERFIKVNKGKNFNNKFNQPTPTPNPPVQEAVAPLWVLIFLLGPHHSPLSLTGVRFIKQNKSLRKKMHLHVLIWLFSFL
jgi:hypothetical protein